MPRAGHPKRGAGLDAGFTLIELVVFVAIVTIVAGSAYATLAQRPVQARGTAIAFAGLVAQARALATISGDGSGMSGSGATIGVVRAGSAYVATLYAYRPIRGALQGPVAAANAAPLRTPTILGVMQGNAVLAPPFALFFSASGHVSAQVGYDVESDPPLAAEPACPLGTGILIAFLDGVHDQAHPLSCEMATLDLDTTAPVVSL